MKKIFIIIIVLLLTFSFFDLKAQDEFDKNKLDDYFSQLEKNNKAMCGVVIRKGGKLVYENYIGFSSLEDKIPYSNLTKFRIGSITKVFTATIIFQLIEEGKLTLETKLSEFYPSIPNAEKITISDMLGHRSGIHDFTRDEEYSQYMTSKKSREEMLELIFNLKSDFKPDEKTEYSNTNYVLLGYIIEKITNSTYQQELKSRITNKLNLTNTYYGGKIDTKMNEAASYRFQEGKWLLESETDMSIPHGAGAIVSNPRDLTIFITALFNNKLVSGNSLNQMKETDDHFGKGLMQFYWGDEIIYGYNGGIDGFVSNVEYHPSENVAVSVTSNGMNYSFNDIYIGILSIYFNLPFEIPDLEAKAIKMEVEDLKKYEGEFSSKLLPLKITLKVENGQLYGQATGQSAFPLTPFSEIEFRFEQAGIIIEFTKDDEGNVECHSFILKQSGHEFPYERE